MKTKGRRRILLSTRIQSRLIEEKGMTLQLMTTKGGVIPQPAYEKKMKKYQTNPNHVIKRGKEKHAAGSGWGEHNNGGGKDLEVQHPLMQAFREEESLRREGKRASKGGGNKCLGISCR